MSKIVVNSKVRALLIELDVACEKFDEANAICCNKETPETKAVESGADRIAAKSLICAIAYRLRAASTGRKLWLE